MRPHTVHAGFNLRSIFFGDPGVSARTVILQIERTVAEQAVYVLCLVTGVVPTVPVLEVFKAVLVFFFHTLSPRPRSVPEMKDTTDSKNA